MTQVVATLAQYPPDPGGILEAIRELLHALLALPEQASTFAVRVDGLHYSQIVVLWLIGLVVLGAAGWFVVRYRRRDDPGAPVRTPELGAPLWLELGVAGLLLTLFITWWVVGFGQYVDTQTEGEDAYEIYVTAKQWTFKFDYPEGRSTAGVVYMPAGRRVRFYVTSRDVIHSFFIPDFRVKQDAVPGRYTTLGVEPVAPGEHQVMCAELCGTGHARMWARAVVLSPGAFERWLEHGDLPVLGGSVEEPGVLEPGGGGAEVVPEPTLAERGREVAVEKGCLGCHTVDGSPLTGPTWRGLWRKREVLQSGDTVVVEPAYITESMMNPEADVVRGFPPVMPSFQGQVTPRETAALIEYIRSLAEPADPRAPAARVPPARGGARDTPADTGRGAVSDTIGSNGGDDA